jgi:hypothetical protein
MARKGPATEVRLLDLSEPRESRRFYIYPFAPVGANVFSVGREGSSKTATWRWLALEAARAGVRVVYFSEDMSVEDDRILMHRYLEGLEIAEKDYPRETLFLVQQQGMNLNTPQGKKLWAETVTRYRADLVINDNYNSLFGGRMAADGYTNWDTAAAYAALLKEIGGRSPHLTIVTICNPPNADPERLPGGQHLPAVCDLRLAFAGRGTPTDTVSRFTVRNTKGSRISVPMNYGGRIIGPRGDDLGPLRVILKPQGDTKPIEFREEDSWGGRGSTRSRSSTPSRGTRGGSWDGGKYESRSPSTPGRPRDADPSPDALRQRRSRAAKKA